MSMLKSSLLTCVVMVVLASSSCWPGKDTPGGSPTPTPGATATPAPSPTPAPFSKPPEKPCAGGKLLISHAYSECGEDGFWHVVQDDYYNCPPVTKFRVAPDTPTNQRCKPGAGEVVPAPKAVGTGYKDFRGGASDCQSAQPTDQMIAISKCENGFWVNEIYRLYDCVPDKSKRITQPPDRVEKTEIDCTKPPPPPRH
jgi:hypothetical protein